MTMQVAFVLVAYMLTYLFMFLLLPGMKAVIYGFNFLIGVLTATLMKLVFNIFRKKNIVKKRLYKRFSYDESKQFLL